MTASGSRLLEMCYRHRLLTTRQVHELYFPGGHIRCTQRKLQRLAEGGMLDSLHHQVRVSALWFVTERGAGLVEAAGGVPVRSYRMTREAAAGMLQKHTLAVNETGLAFVAAARARGDECGPGDWDHEIAFGLRERARAKNADLQADVELRYHCDTGSVLTRLVEVDRDTETVDRLAAKLRVYARLFMFQPKRAVAGKVTQLPGWAGWQHRYVVFPKVIVVLTGNSPARLAGRRERLLRMCAVDPIIERARRAGLDVTVTTLAELGDVGPFEPIFWAPRAAAPVDLLGEAR